ncbi:enoyl-CoA delta isomerase 2 [Caerostris extrusa]|uniref:Enoyl-CoA delta isomerase 2 n=1 Tax=Caerostris extrusa TaxID=172846 RepID=A0AAV4X7Y5_CAEEX|nr:enoyl-CoA delta isomerase 2 [Caerostris extrusa]
MLIRKYIVAVSKIYPRLFASSNKSPLFFAPTRIMSSQATNFEDACKKVKLLKQEPGNDVKLNLYALFKQATEGTCKQSKPSLFDMVGKAKWEAWNTLGTMSQDDARKQYASLVDKLYRKDLIKITFNRPNKKNAITTQMYKDIVAALKEASNSEAAVTLLTAVEMISAILWEFKGDISVAAKNAGELLREFVAAFIDFPKILVAAVNGPAVGIPATLLGLCDVVYASDKATFITPFSLLGQTPEGCSSYTFPKIMGYSKANEILLLSKKFTATEAKELGLVSEVFPHQTFEEDVQKKLAILSEASKNSMIYAKELSRNMERSLLHKVNEDECNRLVERWQSPDCMEALMRFFQRKSKL